MAHILCGWELGANRGHATTLAVLAGALAARGHRISFALQRVDALGPRPLDAAAVWPAPVTPRMLVNMGRPARPANSLGDIIARLGGDDPDLIEALLSAWRRLLEAIRPDVVVANYAPFLLTAARGIVPTVAVGTWFNTPPSDMPTFSSLNGKPPSYDEDGLVAGVNLALGRIGADPIEGLPGMFAASREIAATFAELDRYREWRRAPYAMPLMAGGMPPLADGSGEEVFVYAPEQIPADAPFWEGLARSGLKIRVHVANLRAELGRRLAALGLTVEPAPMPFAAISEQSRLVVSHGGHGFLCSALLAGLPQLVCPFDLEKQLHAQSASDLEVGMNVAINRIEPARFAAELVRAHRNETLRARAQAFALDLRARDARSVEDMVVEAVGSLAGDPR